MRQSKDDEYRELKREAKRQGIEINSIKYSPLTTVDIPVELKDQFAVIQILGRISGSNFGLVPNGDTPDKPWQLHTKKRAIQLMRYAARCRRENRNESGWRYEIEQRLFERFDIEVAWLVSPPERLIRDAVLTISSKRCRKRLWRSEIEVNPDFSNSRTSSLRDRQRKRETCTCNPNGRMDD
jgi:hypothetical protein